MVLDVVVPLAGERPELDGEPDRIGRGCAADLLGHHLYIIGSRQAELSPYRLRSGGGTLVLVLDFLQFGPERRAERLRRSIDSFAMDLRVLPVESDRRQSCLYLVGRRLSAAD